MRPFFNLMNKKQFKGTQVLQEHHGLGNPSSVKRSSYIRSTIRQLFIVFGLYSAMIY